MAVLLLASLVILSVYFRESSAGVLHRAQSLGTSALRPLLVAAERVAQPFEDGAGWVGDLVEAKSENARLRAQVEELRQQLIQNETIRRDNIWLRQQLRYRDSPSFPTDYRALGARIVARAPGRFERQVVIAAGTGQGVRVHDPVVVASGLLGQVTKVAKSVAQVTLLTDETSAVSALDLQTNASGILRHGQSSASTLVLDRVTKDKVVRPGDVVITAGWRVGRLSSIYPRGIPIGVVTSVGQLDTDVYKQIEVAPFVDFGSLDSVLVLIPKGRRR
ncbi:MAG: rod shape-determining protein MreC [Thermoleophilia bacterium]